MCAQSSERVGALLAMCNIIRSGRADRARTLGNVRAEFREGEGTIYKWLILVSWFFLKKNLSPCEGKLYAGLEDI